MVVDLFCGDCISELKKLEDNSVDLIITSPPYAERRKGIYDSIPEQEYPNFMYEVGLQLYRVLKPTGSFILNIKEHTVNGKKSTYVLETVLVSVMELKKKILMK